MTVGSTLIGQRNDHQARDEPDWSIFTPFTGTRHMPSIRTFFEDVEEGFLEGKLVILLKLETCSDLNRDTRSEIWSAIGP